MQKSVLITGAVKNSGRGIAELFMQKGWAVFITSRKKNEAETAASEISKQYGGICKGYALDSLKANGDVDTDAVDEVFLDIRKQGFAPDCVVLNAANLGIGQKIFETSLKEFAAVVSANIVWNYYIAEKAAAQMKEKKRGSIVFINSNTAYRAIPDRIAYTASKSGALGMARALAFDLGRYGIRVNCVLPGMIKTDRWESNYNNCRAAPSNYTPIGDIADFSDVANAAYYFAEHELSKNTTGAELAVDGGNMIQLYPLVPETADK